MPGPVTSTNFGSFDKNPPKVEPSEIEFEVPCKGLPSESVQFYIRNCSLERVIFKVKGTKLDRFKLQPATGFIEAKAVQTIHAIPTKPAENENIFTKTDHFSAVVAPAPKKSSMLPRAIWKQGTEPELKSRIRYQVNIKVRDKRKKLVLDDEEESNESDNEPSITQDDSNGNR